MWGLDEVRSAVNNHPELLRQNSTHIARLPPPITSEERANPTVCPEGEYDIFQNPDIGVTENVP